MKIFYLRFSLVLILVILSNFYYRNVAASVLFEGKSTRLSDLSALSESSPSQPKKNEHHSDESFEKKMGNTHSNNPSENLIESGGWFELGSGVNGKVNCIEKNGTELFVGGSFTSAGNASANRIAKWSTLTNTWSALGSGLNGTVYAIAIDGKDIYVGGDFTMAGNLSVNRIAKWDTVTKVWSKLGNGVDGRVGALTLANGELLVGGHFTNSGIIQLNRVAKYSLSSGQWSGLGGGVNDIVTSLTAKDNYVYVAGYFSIAGTDSIRYLARFNLLTNTWSSLGEEVQGYVSGAAVLDSSIYFVGDFNRVGGASTFRLAGWNTVTNTWTPISEGPNHKINDIDIKDNQIFVVGAQVVFDYFLRLGRYDLSQGTWFYDFAIGSADNIRVLGEQIFLAGGINPTGNQIHKIIGKNITLPTNINLISPFNNSSSVNIPVQLEWSQSQANNGYEVQIALDSLFNTKIFDNDAHSPLVLNDLNAITKYYWRVRGYNLFGYTNYTTPYNFTTGLKKATLYKPSNSSTENILGVKFIWLGIDSVTNYTIEISKSSTFSDILFRDSLLTDTSSFVKILKPHSQYFWRVRGTQNNAIYGDWSQVRTFKVSPLVDLISPANNSITPINNVLLNWTKNPEAENYHLQLSTDSIFNSFIINDSTLIDTSRMLNGLSHNQNYFWRIRPFIVINEGDWSTISSFKASLPNRNAQLLRDTTLTELPCYINVMLHALNMQGKGITDLETAEFELRENGTPISPSESRLQVGKINQLPFVLKTVLLIDNSSSISPNDLLTIKIAAKELIRNRMNEQFIAVYSFSESIDLLQDFTNDSTLLLNAVNSIQIGFASTNLYGALTQGLSRWEDKYLISGITQGNLIVLTDGEDTQGSATLAEVLNARLNKRIYAIGYGTGINQNVLQSIGNAGVFILPNVTNLVQKFIEIQQDMVVFANSFYWLNYMSPKRGNNNHQLRVLLKNNQNTSLSSYFATNFNSQHFYSVVLGIVVNGSAIRPLGYDTLFLPANIDSIIRIEIPFSFQAPNYNFFVSNNDKLSIQQISSVLGQYKIRTNGSQGDQITITINEPNFGYQKHLLVIMSSPVEISEVNNIEYTYSLAQNFPNPFNGNTVITYTLKESGLVNVLLFNSLGQRIKTIVEKYSEKGKYSVEVNLSDLESGVYFYQINAGKFIKTKKLILLK